MMWRHKSIFVATSGFTIVAEGVESEGRIELWNKRIGGKIE